MVRLFVSYCLHIYRLVSVAHRINAAFGVSNKFVPYRPNYDLVSYLASAGGFHDASHGSFVNDADLNTIENGVRLYRAPSHNPSTANYVLVKTYMLDNTTGVQELTSLDSPPKMYTRVKLASTWSSWVETTNA